MLHDITLSDEVPRQLKRELHDNLQREGKRVCCLRGNTVIDGH